MIIALQETVLLLLVFIGLALQVYIAWGVYDRPDKWRAFFAAGLLVMLAVLGWAYSIQTHPFYMTSTTLRGR